MTNTDSSYTTQISERYLKLEGQTDIHSLREKSALAQRMVDSLLQQERHDEAYSWSMENFNTVKEIEIRYTSNEWYRCLRHWGELAQNISDKEKLAYINFASGYANMRCAGVGDDIALGNSVKKFEESAQLFNALPRDYQEDRSNALFFAGIAYELTCDPLLIPFAKQMYMSSLEIIQDVYSETNPVVGAHAAALSLLHSVLDDNERSGDMKQLYSECEVEGSLQKDLPTSSQKQVFWRMISLINARNNIRIALMHPNNLVHPIETATVRLISKMINNILEYGDASTVKNTILLEDMMGIEISLMDEYLVLFNHGVSAQLLQSKPFLASHLYKLALNTAQTTDEAQKMDAYAFLAQAYESLGWHKDAIDTSNIVLDMNGDNSQEKFQKIKKQCSEIVERCKKKREELTLMSIRHS